MVYRQIIVETQGGRIQMSNDLGVVGTVKVSNGNGGPYSVRYIRNVTESRFVATQLLNLHMTLKSMWTQDDRADVEELARQLRKVARL